MTIKAGYDASKALELASDKLGIIEQGLDIAGKGIDNQLKNDDLLFNRPLERTSKSLAIQNAQSTLTGKDLENQQKYQEVYGGKVGAGEYFENFGAITGPNGSPLWKYGLDIDLKKGDPVPSPVNGTIIATKENGGFGKQVQIKGEDGNTFWLSHLDGYIGSVGEKVSAGQMVGIGGNTGNTIPGKGGDGSHLDLTGVRPDGSYMSAQEVQKYVEQNYSSQYTGKAATTGTASGGSVDIYDKNGKVDEQKFTTYISKSLNTVVGDDGFISEDDYDYGKKNWVQMGLSPSDYDERFKQYINPRFKDSYNLDNPDKLETYFMNRSGLQERKDQEKVDDTWSNLGTKTMDFINKLPN
jgi:murein DD-endopeptidase MepM/ murein hydrolase activator NlpD